MYTLHTNDVAAFWKVSPHLRLVCKSISYGLPSLGLFGLGWTPEASRRRIRQALRQTRDIFKFCLEGRLGEKITQL